MPNCRSKPSTVVARTGCMPSPALLSRMSTCATADAVRSTKAWMLARSAMSITDTSTRASGCSRRMRPRVASPRRSSRTARTTCAPFAASAEAACAPIPLLAPVTTAVRPCRFGMSRADQVVIFVSRLSHSLNLRTSSAFAEGGEHDMHSAHFTIVSKVRDKRANDVVEAALLRPCTGDGDVLALPPWHEG